MHRLLCTIFLLFCQNTHGADLSALFSCQSIGDNGLRLQCFDKQLAILKKARFQPPGEFLQSEIRVNVQNSEYDLNIGKFLGLLESARLKDKTPVKILGWRKMQENFTLDLLMEEPVSLTFQYHAKQGFSLLKPVDYLGERIPAEQFILVIAAMTPF